MWVKKHQVPPIKINKLKKKKKKQQVEPDMRQWTGSQLGKEYVKAVYCHPAYLTSMQSTSCKMLDWMNQKLKSRCWEKY